MRAVLGGGHRTATLECKAAKGMIKKYGTQCINLVYYCVGYCVDTASLLVKVYLDKRG